MPESGSNPRDAADGHDDEQEYPNWANKIINGSQDEDGTDDEQDDPTKEIQPIPEPEAFPDRVRGHLNQIVENEPDIELPPALDIQVRPVGDPAAGLPDLKLDLLWKHSRLTFDVEYSTDTQDAKPDIRLVPVESSPLDSSILAWFDNRRQSDGRLHLEFASPTIFPREGEDVLLAGGSLSPELGDALRPVIDHYDAVRNERQAVDLTHVPNIALEVEELSGGTYRTSSVATASEDLAAVHQLWVEAAIAEVQDRYRCELNDGTPAIDVPPRLEHDGTVRLRRLLNMHRGLSPAAVISEYTTQQIEQADRILQQSPLEEVKTPFDPAALHPDETTRPSTKAVADGATETTPLCERSFPTIPEAKRRQLPADGRLYEISTHRRGADNGSASEEFPTHSELFNIVAGTRWETDHGRGHTFQATMTIAYCGCFLFRVWLTNPVDDRFRSHVLCRESIKESLRLALKEFSREHAPIPTGSRGEKIALVEEEPPLAKTQYGDRTEQVQALARSKDSSKLDQLKGIFE